MLLEAEPVPRPVVPLKAEGKTAEAFTLQRRAYGDYSRQQIEEALAAVAANDGNVHHTARQLGIPPQTLDHWVKRERVLSDVQKLKRDELSSKLETIAHRLSNSILEHDLDIVPLAAKATAMGITIEKMQLLRGQPTSITEQTSNGELLGLMREALEAGVIDVTPQDAVGPDVDQPNIE